MGRSITKVGFTASEFGLHNHVDVETLPYMGRKTAASQAAKVALVWTFHLPCGKMKFENSNIHKYEDEMITTVLQIRSNGQITLPASIRRLARLEEGDTLEVIVEEDGSLRLVPKVVVDRSQAYFWSDRWQAGEREAQVDIDNEELHRFDDIDEALTFLDIPE